MVANGQGLGLRQGLGDVTFAWMTGLHRCFMQPKVGWVYTCLSSGKIDAVMEAGVDRPRLISDGQLCAQICHGLGTVERLLNWP